jgi:hypothetical protein
VSPCPQLIFPSKTWFFGIYLNFQQQKSLKDQFLPHSESKSYQINSIKSSCSSRSFQQHQNFKLRLNLIFNEKIIQYSRTFASQVQISWNQSPCTCPRQELSKETKNTIWSITVPWIS